MADCESPSITIRTSNEAQRLSDTDDRPWASILVRRRSSSNGEAHVGGKEVTTTTGGQPIGGSDGDAGYYFAPASGLQWRLTQIYIAGTASDVFDTICKAW